MKFPAILIPIIFLLACTNTNSKEEAPTYPVGHIQTPLGEMYFWLHEQTPNHKASFIKLAEEQYWDTLTFNRVIENFVIQGGCPDTEEGFADSPYLLEPEFNEALGHRYGAVGAGRDDNPGKLSAGCQFYIVHDSAGIDRLDGNYTVFGQVFNGLEVLNKIATTETDSLDAPLTAVPLTVKVAYLKETELDSLGYKIQKNP